eukprot:403371077
MSRFLSRLSKDVTQETYKITLKIVSVTYHTPEDLYGVYIKVKRGKRRTNGQNRYAIYSSVNNVKGKQNSKGNSTVEINEMFEQISVFYRNINNHKFQTKKIVIKLKQENVAAKKDKVLGKVVFDGGLFVGKRDAKCELKFAQSGGKEGIITMEASVLQELKQDMNVTDQLYQDLFFNDSSSNSEEESIRSTSINQSEQQQQIPQHKQTIVQQSPSPTKQTIYHSSQTLQKKKELTPEDIQKLLIFKEEMGKAEVYLESQITKLRTTKDQMESDFEKYMEEKQSNQTKIESEIEDIQKFQKLPIQQNANPDQYLAELRQRVSQLQLIAQLNHLHDQIDQECAQNKVKLVHYKYQLEKICGQGEKITEIKSKLIELNIEQKSNQDIDEQLVGV